MSKDNKNSYGNLLIGITADYAFGNLYGKEKIVTAKFGAGIYGLHEK